ncbi:MAG TPA: HAMP domain-containing sensor histidine kinase [Polyangiaceae bacterium]
MLVPANSPNSERPERSADPPRTESAPIHTPLPRTPSVNPSATQTIKLTKYRTRNALPLLILPPIIVMAVGLAVATGIGIVGLDALARASDAHAAEEADLLAATMAMRLSHLPVSGATTGGTERSEALQLAARRTGSEFLLLDYEGEVLLDASLGAPNRKALHQMAKLTRGEAVTALGRTRFAVRPLLPPYQLQRVVAFVREPPSPEGGPAFVTALIALTTLLVGVAATVAYAVARDANEEVVFLTHRVKGMVRARTEPTGEPVPIRTLDEVGVLASSFNALVGRFSAAESSYRDNLHRASAADRERAAFLAAVSHELRSPLNAILGFADILVTEVDGPLTPSAREEVEQIRGSGAHLLELINDILEFSAIESGQLKLSRAKVDLAILANEVVRESQGLLGGKPVTLRMQGETGVIADADARRVRQILTNLVGNAIKFTNQGQVLVVVGRQGSYATLTVSDTGPGISPAERAMIFEEYKQAGEERAKRRGTGLGLAIARRLVLMHGGTIHVESELGRGSTFRVLIPLWFDRPPQPRNSSSMRAARRRSLP